MSPAGGVAVRGGVGGVGSVGVGMVPVQVPVSVANGHTVYQTVHVPLHAPQHLQIIPQLQQVGSSLVLPICLVKYAPSEM